MGFVTGLEGRPADLKRRLNDLVRGLVYPQPTVQVTDYTINGKCVVRLDVEAGHGALDASLADANRPEYFVRRNGSTYYARPDELTNIISTSVTFRDPASPWSG